MDNYRNGHGTLDCANASVRDHHLTILHNQGFRQVYCSSLVEPLTYRLFEQMNFDASPPTKRFWIEYKGC